MAIPTTTVAQDIEAAIDDLQCYGDGSCGGVLRDESGSMGFHLRITPYVCELWLGARHRGRKGSRLLRMGSDAERAFLDRMDAWAGIAFGQADRVRFEPLGAGSHKQSGLELERYKQAVVLNRLAEFRRVRAAKITTAFPGKGTVSVSFKVAEPGGGEKLVMFRSLGGWARPHLADSADPVPLGTSTELWILQAMRTHVASELGDRMVDAIWDGNEPNQGGPETRAVMSALLDYSRATFPRLAASRFLKDGGSISADFIDDRGRPIHVFFNRNVRIKFRDRIYVGGDLQGRGRKLVPFDSALEKSLLAMLDRWLKRQEAHINGDEYHVSKSIQERVVAYRALARRESRRAR